MIYLFCLFLPGSESVTNNSGSGITTLIETLKSAFFKTGLPIKCPILITELGFLKITKN